MDHWTLDALYFFSSYRASRLLKWLAPGMRFMPLLPVAYTSSCAKLLPQKRGQHQNDAPLDPQLHLNTKRR